MIDGVPQKRQRAIWVGSKFGEVITPTQSDKKFSVGEALADLTHIPINSQTDSWELTQKGEYAEYLDKIFPYSQRRQATSNSANMINGFQATVHTPATQQKYGNTIPGEKEPTTWANRLSVDGFSPTLRAGSGNRTAADPIHYEHARVITVREAARLHSFPDWFAFGASKLAAHKAILLRSHFVNGNSVPPLLAYAIASQVWAHLEEQQNSTIVLRCPGTSCFVFTHLLDLATLEPSVDLRISHSMGQQSGKQNCGIPALVDEDNIKVVFERSPPSNLLQKHRGYPCWVNIPVLQSALHNL